MTFMQKSYRTFHAIDYNPLSNIMKCPCHSGKDYDLCCGPYHKKEKFAETPLLLMRSRYSAYALSLADYIIDTTHPEGPRFEKNRAEWQSSILHFSKTTNFQNLTIESSDESHVTFYATLNTLGRDTSFREKSLFKKWKGRWCYYSQMEL